MESEARRKINVLTREDHAFLAVVLVRPNIACDTDLAGSLWIWIQNSHLFNLVKLHKFNSSKLIIVVR